jgi:hypothetical protein
MVFEVIPFVVCAGGSAALGTGAWWAAMGTHSEAWASCLGRGKKVLIPSLLAPMPVSRITGRGTPSHKLILFTGWRWGASSMLTPHLFTCAQGPYIAEQNRPIVDKPVERAHTGLSPRLSHIVDTMRGENQGSTRDHR